ncbi:thiosulfate sulfurtransferase GlpE [Vibrio gallicus]|uniref:thiosulfate sulfurtransferase GlpE n=1 Tax=Vibrio gallicus TaxID=190897 RepID=UPI0021C3DDFF|nr:thiosulfate sulfurtransferase GlpE [Vibrio gallicus]
MEEVQRIDVHSAFNLQQQNNGLLVDIRDPQSFALAHPKDAFHLTDSSLVGFMQQAEFEQPVLVMCYHGISSVGAAQYLLNQGFEQVYSVEGGFEAWQRQMLPTENA